ncbi:MAG: flippase-like domain-containing protein [Pseudomonadales bacterium]|nr:flippase-like domain-containing protein [Pseudomonadales bacterium]
MSTYKIIYQLVKRMLLIISLVLVMLFLMNNPSLVSDIVYKIGFFNSLLIIVVLMINVAISYYRIQLILKLLNCNISTNLLLREYSKSIIMRYLPGGIWDHASLVASLKEYTKSSFKTLSLVPTLNVISLIIIGVFSFFYFYISLMKLSFIIGTIVLLIITLIYFNFYNLKKIIYGRRLFMNQLIFLFTLTIIQLATVGFAFFICMNAVVKAEFSMNLHWLDVTNAFIASWVAGVLAIPFPSGIGVREFVITHLLSSTSLPTKYIVMVSLVFRVYIIIRDIAFFFFSRIFYK